MEKDKNPGGAAGASDVISRTWNTANNIKVPDNQQALRWLIHRYGVPKIRAATVAELAGIGGGQ